MSVLSEIRATLDAMGAEQQACVFAFLMSYPLVLGRLLDARGRRVAMGVAGAAVVAFVGLTDPWFHAVLLVVVAIGGLGVFIGVVTLADATARRLAWHAAAVPASAPVAEEPLAHAPAARARLPLGGNTVTIET